MTTDFASDAAPFGRYWFLGAGLMGFASAAMHVLGGGPEIMNPLYSSSLPVGSVAVLDVVWQQVTALLIGGGVVGILAAWRPAWRRPVAWLVGGHYAVIAIIFIVWGAIWFRSPWPMPQWILFSFMACLMFTGLKFSRKS